MAASSQRAFWQTGATLTFLSPDSSTVIAYEAKSLKPKDVNTSGPPMLDEPLPMLVYFSGMGYNGGLEEAEKWLPGSAFEELPQEYVLVAPLRPTQEWFLDNDQEYGWVDGEFTPKVVDAFLSWLDHLAKDPSIDEQRVSLLGFSAGAYAVVELLAQNRTLSFRGAIVGGVHGHGQPDMVGIEEERHPKCQADVLRKWDEFLQRLRCLRKQTKRFFAVHNAHDRQSPWGHAKQLYATLLASWTGHSVVVVLDQRRSTHSYFHHTFRKSFLLHLLRDEVPLKCASPSCNYLAHTDDCTFSGFCCKRCHFFSFVAKAGPYDRLHGEKCEMRDAPEESPRAPFCPPSKPLNLQGYG
jgi:dienelactone hydrolase